MKVKAIKMLHWIWVLIVGGVIGLIAGALTGHGKSMNWIANIFSWINWLLIRSSFIRCLGTSSCWHGNCTVNFRCSNFDNHCCLRCQQV